MTLRATLLTSVLVGGLASATLAVPAVGADDRPGLAPEGGLPEIHRHLGEPGEVIARSATMRSADAARDARGFGTGWSDGPLPMPASYPVQPELATYPDEPDDATDAAALWSYDELAPQLTEWMAASDLVSTQVVGQSVQGRDLYLVTLTAPETAEQTAQQTAWRELIRTDPEAAAADAELVAGYKTPIWFSGNVHGNEWEGTDAIMQTIGDLLDAADDPATVELLAGHRLYFSLTLNPDGRTIGQRPGVLGLDINRDMITNTTPESVSYARTAQALQPLYAADLHGYTGVLQVEPCGPPHGDSYEYDLFLPHGYALALQVEDEVLGAGIPANPVVDVATGLISAVGDLTGQGRITIPYRDTPSGWDDFPPIFTAQYAAFHGAVTATVELPLPRTGTTQNPAGATVNTAVGRQVIDSTIDYVTTHSEEMLANQIEVFRRGVEGAPKVQLTTENVADVPGPDEWKEHWDVADDQNPVSYPRAYVIPVGEDQRSRGDAATLVRQLMFHGVEVGTLDETRISAGVTYPAGSYVVDMHQPLRGLAHALLDVGSDISEKVPSMYDVSAWSLAHLWGATVLEFGETGGTRLGDTTPVTAPTSAADAPEDGLLAFPLAGADDLRAVTDVLDTGAAVSLLADGTAVVGPDDRAAALAAAAAYDVELVSPTPAQVDALDDPSTRGLDDLVVGYTGTQDDVLAMEALGLDARLLTAAELDADPSIVDTLDVLWIGSDLGLSDGSDGDVALRAWADAGHGVIGRGAAGLDAAGTYGPVVATGSAAGSSSNAVVALTTPEDSPLRPFQTDSAFVYPAYSFGDLGEGTLPAQSYAAEPMLAGHWTGAGGPEETAGRAASVWATDEDGSRALVFGTSLLFRHHPKAGLGDVGRALYWAGPEGEKVEAPPEPVGTTTTLTVASSRVEYGDDVVLGVEVTPVSGEDATGTVVVTDDRDRTVGTATLSDGVATVRVSGVAPGEREYTASYEPTSLHQASTSTTVAVTIDRASTLTRFKATTPKDGRLRTKVRLRTAEAAGPAVGRVLVLVDGEVERTFRVRRKDEGNRTVTLRLPSGRVQVQVLYRGDDLRAPSRSGTKRVTVG
ncbi:M14 family metallopeptidase [uncultured Nocardioides sp.]|uniref:M14 family metallopeptidase n=1 Tax=uncultured Nocardioides sp. TaxID=198441 RepID=UPI00260534E0|nr:M14 family metallopeptidase [uncultured Nocardioides sp.]